MSPSIKDILVVCSKRISIFSNEVVTVFKLRTISQKMNFLNLT